MLNRIKKWLKIGKNVAPVDEVRNSFDDQALLEAEEKLKYANYPLQSASNAFRQTLKAKILESRRTKFNMNVVTSFFTVRKMAPALAFVLIIGIVMTSVYMWPQSPASQKISRLLINSAYAMDNFSVTASNSDSLGIGADSSFTIKSRDKVDSEQLRKNISLIPYSDFDFTVVNDNEFKVTPKTSLQNKKVYRLQVSAAYLAENGTTMFRDFSWAFQVRDEFKVLRTLPGNKSAGVPTNTGIEMTFSHENIKNFEKYITIEPKVDGKFELHKRTLVFVPKKLDAGKIYTVTISKDLELAGSDKKLAKDYFFTFETDPGNYERGIDWNFGFNQNVINFNSQQSPAFEVYAYNFSQPQFQLSVYSFDNEDKFISALQEKDTVPYWANYNYSRKNFDTKNLRKVADYSVAMQEYSYQKYLVLPNSLPLGQYILETKVKDQVYQVYFQVTDLAVYYSVTTKNSLFWVNDIGTGGAVTNADIELIGKNISAKTNDKGLAELNTNALIGLPEDQFNPNLLVKITSAGKSSVVPLNLGGYYELFTKQPYYNNDNGDNYWMYFYSDRPMYQPTDKINFWGFLKGRDNKKIDQEIKIKLTGGYNYYDDKELVYAEKSITLNNDNTYSGDLNFKNVEPGYYNLKILIGDKAVTSKYIEIQTYTKPGYEINAEFNKRAIFAGDKISLKAKSQFFDGTPVAGLALSIDGNKDLKTYITNDQGEVNVDWQTSYTDCKFNGNYADCTYPTSLNAYIRPEKAEEGNIEVWSQARVFGAAINLDTWAERIDSTHAKVKTEVKKINLDVINSQEDYNYYDYLKEPAPGIKINAEVWEISYEQRESGQYYDFINKVVRKTYDYKEMYKVVGNFSGVSDGEGKFNYDLAVDPNKSYNVNFTVTDNNGRHEVKSAYVPSERWYEYRGNSGTDFYELRFKDTLPGQPNVQKTSYKVDEPVRLQFVKNDKVLPNIGKETYLYYRLQQGLMNYEVSPNPEPQFNFDEKFIPNVYVKGVYFDGKIYHENNDHWGWGGGGSGLNVAFDYESRKLDIAISQDKEKYQPGENVELSVKVVDQNKNPVSAAVNLNLVDEAYYKLVGDYVDPLAELYRNVQAGQLATYKSHDEMKLGLGAEGGGCFLAGTKITMNDGTKKNIEDIKKGDQVLTFADAKLEKKVSGEVTEVFEHLVSEYLIINNNVKVTAIHRMLINNKWQAIGEAKVGDYLIDENSQPVEIRSIRKIRENIKVYNFQVDKYHTYFANGIYVHNDKGGGTRQNFVDVALFKAVTTDSNGEAKVTFKLPDNITGWRVTAQAINNDLYAGDAVKKLIVTLPAFVDVSISNDYLVGDKPEWKARAYGSSLTGQDSVKFTVDAPAFGLNKAMQEVLAFKPAYFTPTQLVEGSNAVRFDLSTAKGNDSVQKTVNVARSHQVEAAQKFYELKEGLKVEGSAKATTKLVFSDLDRGQIYNELVNLSYSGGDRVDQELSRLLATKWRTENFHEIDLPKLEFDLDKYQINPGGIALLPYADPDYELSAKIASLHSDYFDKISLASYFYDKLNNQNSNSEEISTALYGLASLEEPVLMQIQNFSQAPDLKVKEKLYIALAAYEIGDKELARSMYNDIIAKNSEKIAPYLRINVGVDQDDVQEVTTLTAVLAAGLNDANRDALWNYVTEKESVDIISNLEELMYMSKVIPNQTYYDKAKFSVTIDGKTTEYPLELGRVEYMNVLPEQLANIQFSNISGRVGLVSYYETNDVDFNKVNSEVTIKRQYLVNGKPTATFKDGDLVEINIEPTWGAKSLDGYYSITDFLPAGLRIITNPYMRNYYPRDGVCVSYPNEINGQVIKFGVYKNIVGCNSNSIRYFARVAATGEFTVEPAVIQANKSAEMKNYSTPEKIKIGR